jgi:hypothetical protein
VSGPLKRGCANEPCPEGRLRARGRRCQGGSARGSRAPPLPREFGYKAGNE